MRHYKHLTLALPARRTLCLSAEVGSTWRSQLDVCLDAGRRRVPDGPSWLCIELTLLRTRYSAWFRLYGGRVTTAA